MNTKDARTDVIIIGAGIAGIAAAIRLQVSGKRVVVLEAAEGPGGKLSQFRLGGYRFDRGPSLFTMPHWVDELFELAGEKAIDNFPYRRLDPVTKYFFADGSRFRAWKEREKLLDEFEKQLGESRKQVETYLDRSRDKYEFTAPFFVENSLHRLKTYLTPKLIPALLKLPTLGTGQTLNAHNKSKFKNPNTVQLFNRYATYNGSDPYQAPAALSLIPHLEFNIGAFLPVGGMYSITDSLYRMALRLGVEFRFETPVQEIVLESNKVSGIRLANEVLKAPVVLSNADVFTTYRRLLPNNKAPERILKQPRSSSALIFYWGIKHTFPELDVHNIFFSSDYKWEFKEIFVDQNLPKEPTVYVNISSKIESSDAPEGCENWFVMINVPANTGQDWDQLIPEARKTIIEILNKQLGTLIEDLIEEEAVFEPRTIESLTGSWQGSLYGTSSNNAMAAFLRHSNKSRSIKGLYFCGGSVHPGGGIPLCLQSGKIAAQMIIEDAKG